MLMLNSSLISVSLVDAGPAALREGAADQHLTVCHADERAGGLVCQPTVAKRTALEAPDGCTLVGVKTVAEAMQEMIGLGT